MIFAVSPNPALDLSGRVDQIIPNEKNYIQSELRSPGGNAINAARIIHRLGYPVTTSGFLGGSIGYEIAKLLNEEKVKQEFVEIRGDTRINVNVLSLKTHQQTRLSFAGPSIRANEAKKLLQKVKRLKTPALLIIGGSLPLGFQINGIRNLIASARQRNIFTVLDIPGQFLKQAMSSRPILIKPNLTEFQNLVSQKLTSIKAIVQASQKILRHVPLICVSSVEGGALLISSEGVWFGKCPKVNIKTTVGAGDSMVGAMCTRIYKKILLSPLDHAAPIFSQEDVADILGWGLAAATATLTHRGTRLGTQREIQKYYSRVMLNQWR